jgi:HlyD family secretion protein
MAWAMSGRTADRFTTATVAMGSVQQTVSATGTVASASRRDVSFPVAGTVAAVNVGLGQTVTAGQVLASLDPTSLQSALDAANTTLQQAQQQLSDDLESQTASTSSTSTTSATSSTSKPASDTSSAAPTQPSSSSSPSSATGTSPEVDKASQAVAAAQQALLQAYDEAHTALGVSTQALTDAQTACTGITGLDPSTVVADGSTPTPTPTDTATPAPTPSPTASATADPTAPTVSDVQALIATCQQKLSAASTAQADTKTKQQAVSDAATALDKAVAALQQALASSGTGSTGTGSSGTGSSGKGSTGTGSTGTHSSTSSTSSTPSSSSSSSSTSSQSHASSSSSTGAATGRVATAADILSDRAAIDAAQGQADMATQDLALVNLTSPIAGTVGAVSISVGSHVSAGSTSSVITVLGNDGYVVNITVPLSSLNKVKVGQTATAAVPSTSTQLTGKVSSIGVLDVSSTSTPEYALVVALDPTQEKLFDGSSAQVSIAVAGTGQVITVPTSAVHISGQTASVQVLANGQVSDVTVQRGAVGAQLTEITSGLSVGQAVVLADHSQALPNTSTNNNQNSGLSGLTNRSTTRIGTGGGGFAPGGFSGRGG